MYESQTNQVLEHLEKYGTITSWEAITKYSITRLSACIYNLRRDHGIKTELVARKDGKGRKKHYALYTLVDGREEMNEQAN